MLTPTLPYVTVAVMEDKRRLLPGSLRLETTVVMAAGTTLWPCSQGYSDHLSAPQLRWTMEATLEHCSTTTGIVLGAPQDALAVQKTRPADGG